MSIYSNKYGSYDKGRREIARAWGLTGVQAGHLADKLDKKGYDYQSFDFGGTTGEVRDYGKGSARYKGAKKFLHDNYGVNVDDPWDNVDMTEMMDMEFHARGSRSVNADLRRAARHVFKSKNQKGASKWSRHPNRYDIEGIDTPPGWEF